MVGLDINNIFNIFYLIGNTNYTSYETEKIDIYCIEINNNAMHSVDK